MSKEIGKTQPDQQALLDELQVRLIGKEERNRFDELMEAHHYLGAVKPAGRRLYYVATDAQGRWVGLMLFEAAARHLKYRDEWIGWTEAQRQRRLGLIANNSRFCLLPKPSVPNLATKVLGLVLSRLSRDWKSHHGHPVLMVESFVDPEQFCGTVYTANNWQELGHTDGWGRCGRDYYIKHDRPKRLFVRQLHRNARRSLAAEHLKPELAVVEERTVPRCTYRVKEIRPLTEHFKQVPEYRGRIDSYPLWSLLTLVLLAMLCEAPQGQKELAKFARRLSQAQRRALGIRRNRHNKNCPAPSQSTFCRLFQQVDGAKVNEVILAIQEQLRGKPPKEELIVLDGKEPNNGPGDSILTASCSSSQYYLGSALVTQKTNEIPVAQELFGELDLQGRWVSLDALHTQQETARQLVIDHGAEYLLTVKSNQPSLLEAIGNKVSAPKGGFSRLQETPQKARTVEWNKGRLESRTLQSQAVLPEDIGFPGARQIARLLRRTKGRKDQLVGLITSLTPEKLTASQWLGLNRQAWGIENELHQRLDVSLDDDRCRFRTPHSLWIIGMFRRLATSLFMQWRSYFAKPKHKTFSDLQTRMSEEQNSWALRFVTSKRPALKPC